MAATHMWYNNKNKLECYLITWWRHQMETFSALLALLLVTGEFPAQRPVTRSFDVFFDLRLNKQSRGCWFETPSCPLWHHCNEPARSMGLLVSSVQYVGCLQWPWWTRNVKDCLGLKSEKCLSRNIDDVIIKITNCISQNFHGKDTILQQHLSDFSIIQYCHQVRSWAILEMDRPNIGCYSNAALAELHL